ncbi:MAG: biosynthetic peptidoglycan transglycosylase, partial [Desulfovibrionales bacterium]
DDVPQRLKQAFVAAEDDRFYSHPGVDWFGLTRAAWNLLLTGEKTQGGSTITMQVARNFFLTRERTYIRKIREIFLALQMEQVPPPRARVAVWVESLSGSMAKRRKAKEFLTADRADLR